MNYRKVWIDLGLSQKSMNRLDSSQRAHLIPLIKCHRCYHSYQPGNDLHWLVLLWSKFLKSRLIILNLEYTLAAGEAWGPAMTIWNISLRELTGAEAALVGEIITPGAVFLDS